MTAGMVEAARVYDRVRAAIAAAARVDSTHAADLTGRLIAALTAVEESATRNPQPANPQVTGPYARAHGGPALRVRDADRGWAA